MGVLASIRASDDNNGPSADTPFVNGNNKLLEADRGVHNWYRFVLSYPPHLVRQYVARFGLGAQHRILDPFCGTGTTLVECKKNGIPSVGVEPNPMAFFASRVKTNWAVDAAGLIDHAKGIADKVNRKFGQQGLADARWSNGLGKNTASDTPLELKTLAPESMKLLLTDSISPLPLHKSLVLLDEINKKSGSQFRDYELLALAKGLVGEIGNLHFGPEVGVGPAKPDAPVADVWLRNVLEIAEDLKCATAGADIPCDVHCSDSRRIIQALGPRSVDAVITSPPYPNEKDYTRTTRLESVVLGFIKDKAELQAFKRTLMRSNTRNVYKGDEDDQWVSHMPEIQQIALEIEARRISLGKTSGFERMYAKVTKLYFGGMARHLAELRTVLKPGAQLAYVVGDQASYLRVMIRTGQLLGKIAVGLGYQLVGIDLFRTRLATATKEQLREEVVVLRWPGNNGAGRQALRIARSVGQDAGAY